MAGHGHGNHWECLLSLNDLPKQLNNLLQNGKLEDKEVFFDSEIQIFSFSLDSDLSALALIAAKRDKTSNVLVSAYPFVRNGEKLSLKIIKINEWSNKYEATIVTKTKDEQIISFFDTKYYKNKEKYKIGDYYTFSVSALGYNVEILKNKSLTLNGQQAADWLTKTGETPTYDNNGNIEPVAFDLSKLVLYLPQQDDFPDDAEFQSPINRVEKISAFQTDFYKFKIQIFRDSDVFLDLYAQECFFEKKPTNYDSLRGVMWIQGYMIE